MAVTKTKKKFPVIAIYLIYFLIVVGLIAYWDHNDTAKVYTQIGGVCISIPILVLFYTIVGRFSKVPKNKNSQETNTQKYLSKLSWLPPVFILIFSVYYAYPHLKHILLANYGVHEQAYVSDHYYTYSVAPFGSIGTITAGTKKTDEYSGHTEVVKYKTVSKQVSGTIDFPYDAYKQTRELLINEHIRHNKTIEIVYLRYLPIISEPVTPTN